MKRNKSIIGLLICLGLAFVFSSCEDKKEAYVTFGANYHVLNCPVTVTVFLNGENIGTLQNSVDAINDCGEAGNITKKIGVGTHNFDVVAISSYDTNDFLYENLNGINGCTKYFKGTFTVSENECKKIFFDFDNQSNCNQNVIISKTEYENAPNDFLEIIDMKIVGNCLKIKFWASGCDRNTWNVKLIDTGIVAESLPEQRTLKLSLENSEDCRAVVTKEISFNIEELQVHGSRRIQLNVSENWILYEY